jgi:predicted glycoside hydrolase/deacetylase ChbG (UPF0249 family)
MKQKVIFTADDYGPIPSINDGIIEAVKTGCINSVEAFANQYNFKESINRLINECDSDSFELGCHLTITSGKPITGMKSLFVRNLSFNKKGYFRKYTDLRRPFKQAKRDDQVKILKEELNAQIYQFEKHGFKDKLTHLSCHHNALFFFEDYLNTYFELAKENNLAVRTPHGIPFKRHKSFIQIVVALSAKNLSLKDRNYMIQFAKKIPDLSNMIKNPPPPNRPVYHINANYGPLGLKVLDEEDIDEYAEEKHALLKNYLEKYENKGISEYVFHLITDDFAKHQEYKNQALFKNCNYTGIDSTYFDSRMAEIRSLIKYKNVIDNMTDKVSWKQV